jgi:hypothetical protein
VLQLRAWILHALLFFSFLQFFSTVIDIIDPIVVKIVFWEKVTLNFLSPGG